MEREESYCAMRYKLMKIAKCCDYGSREVGEYIGVNPTSNLNVAFGSLETWRLVYNLDTTRKDCKCDAKVVVAPL